jgi:hypothetical protein
MNSLISWKIARYATVPVLPSGDEGRQSGRSTSTTVPLPQYCRSYNLTLLLPDDASMLHAISCANSCHHVLGPKHLDPLKGRAPECSNGNAQRCAQCWGELFFKCGFVLAPEARRSGSFVILSQRLEDTDNTNSSTSELATVLGDIVGHQSLSCPVRPLWNWRILEHMSALSSSSTHRPPPSVGHAAVRRPMQVGNTIVTSRRDVSFSQCAVVDVLSRTQTKI